MSKKVYSERMRGGLSTILLIVIILAVGIIGASIGYYYGANSATTTTSLITATRTTAPKVTTTAVGATTTAVDTANWKTYTNTDYGFSFKYPGDWNKEENNQNDFSDIIFSSANNSEVKNPLIIRVYGGKTFSGHAGPNTYFDVSKSGTKKYFIGESDEFIFPNGYGDAGGTTPPYIVERFIKNNNTVYAFEFYGNTNLSDTENQILSTFRFTQ